uniref:Reverse transcriptase Ty1/copia-type domain-containing protein n=1 Tax=Triticum urartu TaxID=4572 RepID=A0A8R7U5M8_TRIUA
MHEEYDTLMRNNTWCLVSRPGGANVVIGKWIFRHKFHPDGSLARYKARWVLRGFTQQAGVDYGETFRPVVKPTTIRTVLSIAAGKSWPIHQLDVKNAFLHSHLAETVYCHQPSGFIDSAQSSHVCRLNRSLYGLKQAPCAWFSRFTTYLRTLGFTASCSDSSLFILHRSPHLAYLLLYVDDIILTADSSAFLEGIIQSLRREFAMTDLDALHHFLGINVTSTTAGLFLSQEQYALEILDRAGMLNCKAISTPVDTLAKLSGDSGPLFHDPSLYRSLARALQYLTLTRPDLSYVVQQCCLFMHAPRESHFQLVKRIMRYVRGTTHMGLQIHGFAASELAAYSDANWAGCPDTHKSTSGFYVFLGSNLLTWSSKRQNTVSRSSAEAEYRAVANAVTEAAWL